jgi:Family of unknown function (DUF6298)
MCAFTPAFSPPAVTPRQLVPSSSSQPPGLQLLTRSKQNPRYFAEVGTGKIVYLTGSENGSVTAVADLGPTHPPPHSDFYSLLDGMHDNSFNFVRLWSVENPYVEENGGGPGNFFYASPLKYARTGPGLAWDGRPKFNLDVFDQRWFDRLRERVIAAGERGLYVGVQLLEGYESQFGTLYYAANPWRGGNNVNGIDVDTNRNGKDEEFYTHAPGSAAYHEIAARQESYIRKVVDTVNDLDNVIYEICNESGAFSSSWQNHLADFIRSYESTKSKQHMVWISSFFDNAALYRSHADAISPRNPANPMVMQPADPTPVSSGEYVILYDTDHVHEKIDPSLVWRSFCNGLNFIFYDDFDASNTANQAVRLAMADTHSYADRLDLANDSPSGTLSSTGFALAARGKEYLVFAPAGGRFTVDLSAGAGKTFAVEWYNVATRARTLAPALKGGNAAQAFNVPMDWDRTPSVLFLKAIAPGVTQ